MDKRTKVMIFATIILLVALVAKSLWIDPVGNLDEAGAKYSQFALAIAPKAHNPILLKPPIVSYRVVSVNHGEKEGESTVILTNIGDEQSQVTLEGHYSAKVRVYFLGVFPYRDIQIKGGIN